MATFRTLLCLVCVAAPALCIPVAAQVLGSGLGASPAPETPPRGAWLPGSRTYLGLNFGRTRYGADCGATAILCDEKDRPTEIYTGTMVGKFWGVELGYLDMGRIARAGGDAHAQGLNLSLVGKARLGGSLGMFGKVGTTYGRTETSLLPATGGSGQGFGLSYGGGLSVDFTRRLSATLEWDRNDFRFGGGRDPVRSTSLGLQYRY